MDPMALCYVRLNPHEPWRVRYRVTVHQFEFQEQ